MSSIRSFILYATPIHYASYQPQQSNYFFKQFTWAKDYMDENLEEIAATLSFSFCKLK